jgi:predicted alpha/beta-hydrolase family hydrolase
MAANPPNQPAFEEKTLAISGYQNQNVANTFFHQHNATDRLAIVLPGAGYSARMPLLYYTVSLFLDQGADVLTVDYEYRSVAARNDPSFQQKLTEDVIAAAQVVLQQRGYRHVVLIGKSVGTRAMSWVLSSKASPFADVPDLKTVWLTPIWSDPQIFQSMLNWDGKSLHIIGTADRHYYSGECEQQIAESNKAVMAIPNADHSLDVDGDLKASLDAVYTAVEAIRDFAFAK